MEHARPIISLLVLQRLYDWKKNKGSVKCEE